MDAIDYLLQVKYVQAWNSLAIITLQSDPFWKNNLEIILEPILHNGLIKTLET